MELNDGLLGFTILAKGALVGAGVVPNRTMAMAVAPPMRPGSHWKTAVFMLSAAVDAPARNCYTQGFLTVRKLTLPFRKSTVMYAIISDGSRQLKVEEGQEVLIGYRDMKAGEKLTFDRVLAVGGDGDAKLGLPLVQGASVTAEVVGPAQGEKHIIQKMRRRKNFRKKTGFRAMFTRVKIGKISG
jgi:large subunit ribosomal protein L21